MTNRSTGQGQQERAADVVETIASLTDDILPALTARLRASGLGEIEVRSDGWRVRLRREMTSAPPAAALSDGAKATVGLTAPLTIESGEARSPAVGYFTPVPDLVIGQFVRVGDSLGAVDMLGVVQDVPAPRDGVVSRVLAETGQAVEYGQALVEVDVVGGSSDEWPGSDQSPGSDESRGPSEPATAAV